MAKLSIPRPVHLWGPTFEAGSFCGTTLYKTTAAGSFVANIEQTTCSACRNKYALWQITNRLKS